MEIHLVVSVLADDMIMICRKTVVVVRADICDRNLTSIPSGTFGLM